MLCAPLHNFAKSVLHCFQPFNRVFFIHWIPLNIVSQLISSIDLASTPETARLLKFFHIPNTRFQDENRSHVITQHWWPRYIWAMGIKIDVLNQYVKLKIVNAPCFLFSDKTAVNFKWYWGRTTSMWAKNSKPIFACKERC